MLITSIWIKTAAAPPFWTLSLKDLLAELRCDDDGLSSAQANRRTQQYGSNADRTVRVNGVIRAILGRLLEPLSLSSARSGAAQASERRGERLKRTVDGPAQRPGSIRFLKHDSVWVVRQYAVTIAGSENVRDKPGLENFGDGRNSAAVAQPLVDYHKAGCMLRRGGDGFGFIGRYRADLVSHRSKQLFQAERYYPVVFGDEDAYGYHVAVLTNCEAHWLGSEFTHSCRPSLDDMTMLGSRSVRATATPCLP